MLPPNQGPDQHSYLLQMLKRERITLEDAEKLFPLLNPGESRGTNGGGGSGSVPERKYSDWSGFAGISSFVGRLKLRLSGIEEAVRQTLQAMDVQSAVDSAIATAHTTSEGRLSEELWGNNTWLVIENPWGDIVLRGVPQETSSLEVSYRVAALSGSKRTADYNAEYTRVSVERAEEGLRVHITPPAGLPQRRLKVDLSLELPRTAPVTVRSECGDFTAADLDGTIDYSGGIGDVVLKRLRGSVQARTDLGNVHTELIPDEQVELDAHTAVGSLNVDVPVNSRIRTENKLVASGFADGFPTKTAFYLRTSSGTVTIIRS